MAGLGGRHIRELSGGQQQRVFLARALFTKAQVIFLDEPTSGLDVRTRHDVLHLLDDLNAQGLTIVLTTHDLNGIAAHLPTVVCLNRSVIGAGRPDEVLVPDVLERTYGSPMAILEHGGMRVVVDAPVDTTVTPLRQRRVRRRVEPPDELGRTDPTVRVRVLPQRGGRRHDRRRAVWVGRLLRGAAQHELHRPRPVAFDLRRATRSPVSSASTCSSVPASGV
jgi:energy-coupling factor transporter ATP-binding protein EcfA2